MDHPHSVDGSELMALLDLEVIEHDLYRGSCVFPEPEQYTLYGGQVAAQALIAAGRTVEEGRHPHSLHGYFLRAGDSSRPTVFHVYRDRDGRSYSARRVVAIQNGEVIFNMSSSFHVDEDGPDVSSVTVPTADPPDAGEEFVIPRLLGMEGRLAAPRPPGQRWPTRFWARATTPIDDDPLLHCAVLTYLSDISSGLFGIQDVHGRSGASLDHAVWFHRPARLDEWVLMDLVPSTVARGRGFYSGTLHDTQGRLLASLVQESLFRSIAP